MEDQQGQEGSIYENLKALIALRKANPELMNDSGFEIVYEAPKAYPFAYRRGSFTAFVNPSDDDKAIDYRLDGAEIAYLIGGYEADDNTVTIRSRSFLLVKHG